jgi:hypothetical protein
MSAVVPRARLQFYPLIAILLVAFIVVAFSRTYYLRFLSDRPPLQAILQVHGVVFTAWLALFVAQTQLVAARRSDLHMKIAEVGRHLT